MKAVRYLSVFEVTNIHRQIVERTGFQPLPLARPDRLEAALARPETAATYEDADLIRQAAVLAIAISQSQAFMDGNKRAAFASCDVFLTLNGADFTGEAKDFARQLELLAERSHEAQVAAEAFEAWLRANVNS